MTKTATSRALAASLSAIVGSAHAVSLNPNGMGQVLLYPYYTVNAGQQTLLTIANTASVGKVVKLRFLEAYNGRTVLDYNVFLSPHDVYSTVVFKLSDAGLSGSGAAIFSDDHTCTAPQLAQGPLPNGAHYQQFLPYAYTGSGTDTGPTSDARTNEGHIEVIAMDDIVPGSTLDTDVKHVNGVPPTCSHAESDLETLANATAVPTSGLFGSASIVDVAEGTFYAYNAEALEGFTAVKLTTQLADGQPNLASVNDAGGSTATARRILDGVDVNATFPAAHAIDAVSAVLAADALYNDYVISTDGSAGTDWVVTFPTKRYYVDKAILIGQAIPPFTHLFGAVESGNGPGLSCVDIGYDVFDREERTVNPNGCSIDPCPPAPLPAFCYETNVLRFFASSDVLGSQLGPQVRVNPFTAGLLQIHLDDSSEPHAMNAAANGDVYHGLPAIGFAATKYINGSVPLSGGGNALANYSGTYRHRATAKCTNAAGACS